MHDLVVAASGAGLAIALYVIVAVLLAGWPF